MVGKISGGDQHYDNASDQGTQIRYPRQQGGSQSQEEGWRDPERQKASAQRQRVQQREQHQALEITPMTFVEAREQEERFLEESIGHAPDDVTFKAAGILQEEIDQVGHEKECRQPLQELQDENPHVFSRKLVGKIFDLSIH